MEISGTNLGASTYAMKKAIERPNILLNLIQQSAAPAGQSLDAKNLVPSNPPDLAAITGKGKIIDLVS